MATNLHPFTCSVHPCAQTFVCFRDVTQRVSLEGVKAANLGEINQCFFPVKPLTLGFAMLLIFRDHIVFHHFGLLLSEEKS